MIMDSEWFPSTTSDQGPYLFPFFKKLKYVCLQSFSSFSIACCSPIMALFLFYSFLTVTIRLEHTHSNASLILFQTVATSLNLTNFWICHFHQILLMENWTTSVLSNEITVNHNWWCFHFKLHGWLILNKSTHDTKVSLSLS